MKKIGGWTGAFVLAFLGFALLVRDVTFVGLVLVMLAAFGSAQFWIRSRSRRRRATGAGTGRGNWHVRLYFGKSAIVGRASRVGSWIYNELVPADVTTTSDGMEFTPSLGARRAGFQVGAIDWKDVVCAAGEDIGRTAPNGKLSLTSQTLITLTVTKIYADKHVPPLSPKETAWIEKRYAKYARRHPEDVLDDAEDPDDGAGAGAYDITLTCDDDAQVLVDTINRWARGKPAT